MTEETTGFPNIESNQLIYNLFIMSGVQILETFLALHVLWPNQNQVAQLKFKLFKTRPAITVSTKASFIKINFVYMNKRCFSTTG